MRHYHPAVLVEGFLADPHNWQIALYLTALQTGLIDLALYWKRAATTRRGKVGLAAIATLMVLGAAL